MTTNNGHKRYRDTLGFAAEDLQATVRELAEKGYRAERITEDVYNRAFNRNIQWCYSFVSKAELPDVLNVLKALAERLEELQKVEDEG